MSKEPKSSRPIVIGIIGGVASGKSAVTQVMADLGAHIISADAIAHRVLGEPEIIDSIVQEFGLDILSDNRMDSESAPRTIDRKKLGALVFNDKAIVVDQTTTRLQRLEAIVHPKILQIAKAELRAYQEQHGVEYIVLDAPLLIEGGWLPFCDMVVFVDTPDPMRRAFALQRGWSEEQWQRRENAQVSLEEKRKQSTDILVNDGTFDQLKDNVMRLIAGINPPVR